MSNPLGQTQLELAISELQSLPYLPPQVEDRYQQNVQTLVSEIDRLNQLIISLS